MTEKIVEQKKDGEKSRRDFLNILLSGGFIAWLGAVIYPLYSYLKPPQIEVVKVNSVNIGKVDDMVVYHFIVTLNQSNLYKECFSPSP